MIFICRGFSTLRVTRRPFVPIIATMRYLRRWVFRFDPPKLVLRYRKIAGRMSVWQQALASIEGLFLSDSCGTDFPGTATPANLTHTDLAVFAEAKS